MNITILKKNFQLTDRSWPCLLEGLKDEIDTFALYTRRFRIPQTTFSG